MNIPDEPSIARVLETGYPYPLASFRCCQCDTPILEDDPYYEIDGKIYCPDCIERMMHYA